MKYKGFVIEKRYSICADWKLNAQGQVVSRRPRKEDIECYDIFDPMDNGERFCSEDSVEECKAQIRSLLAKMNMKDNSPQSWAALDWNTPQ